MTTTTRNEAAERLDGEIRFRTPLTQDYMLTLMGEALAAERRITVERIREWLLPVAGDMPENLWSFLDELAGLRFPGTIEQTDGPLGEGTKVGGFDSGDEAIR